MTPKLNARLWYLHLASPSPERLAAFYGDALGMQVEAGPQGWRCVGPERRMAIERGEAKGLLSVGYAMHDAESLSHLRQRLKDHDVPTISEPTPFFGGEAITLHDPDGNRISYGLATTDTVPIDALEARLQHVGLATCDPARLNAFYERTVGYQTSDQVLDGTETLCALFLRSDHEHHSLALFQAQENRIDHQCYEVANWNGIRDWGDHFAALRIAIQWGPGRHGPGNNLFLFVHDPDGNWVEFSAELEVVAPDRPVGIWAHEERTLNSWGQAFLRS